MIISQIPIGSRIRVKLKRQSFASQNQSSVYVTSVHSQKKLPHKSRGLVFTEGVGTVLENTNNKLKMSFVGLVNPDFSGTAEIDYFAFQSIHMWEGETNASTLKRAHKIDFKLEREVEHKSAVPPMDIYRKEIQLIWTDEK